MSRGSTFVSSNNMGSNLEKEKRGRVGFGSVDLCLRVTKLHLGSNWRSLYLPSVLDCVQHAGFLNQRHTQVCGLLIHDEVYEGITSAAAEVW